MALARPTFLEERTLIAAGFLNVAGVDEAGCGCLAGPVFAAAVILPLDSRLGLIRDSKLLSEGQRFRLAADIKQRCASWAIGVATHQEIDELNIRQAAALAMRRAVEALTIAPDYILSDAFKIPGLTIPCKNIIHGDARIKSIAAASIIAKVERDKLMDELDRSYPGYGFAVHKGYATKLHQKALMRLGPCEIHRKTYGPVKKFSL